MSSNSSVQAALALLAKRLNAIISKRLAGVLGSKPWTNILTELDRAKGISSKVYTPTDLQSQLRMLTERLGGLGFPFETGNTREVSTLGNELRIIRNRWAHNDSFTALDAWRAHDFVLRLLECFGDQEGIALDREAREAALVRVMEEEGVAPVALSTPNLIPEIVEDSSDEIESVEPDPAVLVRDDIASTPMIGAARAEFEPWQVFLVGDVSVLDDLPKKVAKDQVRAVAVEITEFEGPIHQARLAQLVAASFGVRRLYDKREQQLIRQFKAAGLRIDADKFVWSSRLDPDVWTEFRPNSSEANRSFLYISPVEIANAARFLTAHNPGLGGEELETAVLQTFGRRRRTRQFVTHLRRSLG